MSDYKDSYLSQLRKLVGDKKVIITSARAVVRDSFGRVLFIRRSDNHTWGMPAGSQEVNESILECLFREVKEETGLDVISAKPMAIYSNLSIETAFGDPYQVFVLQFLVDEWEGDLVTETDETIDARFFYLNDLPAEIPEFYQMVIDDLRNYTGNLILK
ncbi:NUDIX domain-containing protein [Chloroflexota bacterium]